ncbi:MAG: 50S ribosomal protein L18e [Candidatus Aenigmarchaeota archaeon]|nr:50S ribosomal protein L18e [Candidatus Aenigmarchaeota archaeon]
MKIREFKDEYKKQMVLDLKKQYSVDKKPLWLDLAKRLNKPTRNMPDINLAKIQKKAKENDLIIVVGKILGNGKLDKKLTLSSFKISQSAMDKIEKAKCKYINFEELMKIKKINNVKIMA